MVAQREWQSLRAAAVSRELQLIVSNTTAAGLTLEAADDQCDFLSDCPASFPAKLAGLLHARYQQKLPGLTVLPMELVDENGTALKKLVLQQAISNAGTNEPDFIHWLQTENRWLNNLVDRIVVSPTGQPPWPDDDPLAVMTEPFCMLAIEDDGGRRDVLPDDRMVTWTDDLAPYFVRKVRILNGLHTAMVARFLPEGFQTVLQCVTEKTSRQWLEELLFDEILPTLAARGLDEEPFARQVMERFENPFFEHRLADIANGHVTKLSVRLQPSRDEYVQAFGREPRKLNQILNASKRVPT